MTMQNEKNISELTVTNSKGIEFGGAYILTVDDQQVIRRIIVNTLRGKEAHVDEATDGMIALSKIRLAYENEVPYDLVFLDMEMPGVTGVEVLETLRADPILSETPVIILSSKVEQREIKKCVELGVYDYIVKPLSKDRLFQAVAKVLFSRGVRQHSAGGFEEPDGSPPGSSQATGSNVNQGTTSLASPSSYRKNIFKQLESIENLPSLPPVVDKVKQLANDPETTADQMALIIETDPSMVVNIFKLANSAAYGGQERIEELSMAIMRLGFSEITNIVSVLGVLSLLGEAKVDGFDYKDYCKHSICVGVAMGVVNKHCEKKLSNHYTEDLLQLMGLLHDIGKLIIMQFYEDKFLQAVQLSREKSMPLYVAEEVILGVDHAAVGEWVGKKWDLPDMQRETMSLHHVPFLKKSEHQELILLCHFGNYLCNLCGLGDGGDAIAPALDQRIFKKLEVTPHDIPPLLDQLKEEAHRAQSFMSLMG